MIAYAYVSDLREGEAAARYLSLLTLVTGLAPVLAPLAGAQILALWNWRAVFVAITVLSAVVLVACAGALPESRPPHLRPERRWRRTGSVYGGLLRDRSLMGPVLANALSFAVMFAYISGSPFVLQTLYGLSPQQYSLVFAVNALGLVAAAGASGLLVGRLGAGFLLLVGVTGTAAASAVLLVFAITVPGLWPILAALFAAILHVGLVLPNAAALVLRRRGSHAGAAAALLGCGQFLFGGLAAPLVGLPDAHGAVPMALVMAALGLAAPAVLITLTPAVAADPPVRASDGRPPEEVHHDHTHDH